MASLGKVGQIKNMGGFQLNLSTNGHCFLCLMKSANKHVGVSTSVPSSPPSSSSPSFQKLCEYLKVDMGKLVEENLNIPGIGKKMDLGSSSTAIMQVTLCETCEHLSERLSSLLENLRKIQMEIGFCLGGIYKNILDGESNPELTEQYQESMTRDLTSLIMIGFIDELKKEIFSKCSEMQVGNQALTHVAEVPANVDSNTVTDVDIRGIPNLSTGSDLTPGILSGESYSDTPTDANIVSGSAGPPTSTNPNATIAVAPETSSGRVLRKSLRPKQTVATSHVMLLNADQKITSDSDESFVPNQDDDEDKMMDTDKAWVSFKTSKQQQGKRKRESCEVAAAEDPSFSEQPELHMATSYSVSTIGRQIRFKCGPVQKRYKKDVNTGKYKCPDLTCKRKFASLSGVRSHHHAAHLNITFKCPKCNRDDFRYTSTLYYHKQNCDGLGGSVEGKRAKRSGTSEYSWDQSTGKYKCLELTCTDQFATTGAVRLHHQRVHLNIRYKCQKCQQDFADSNYMRKHSETCEGLDEVEEEEEGNEDKVINQTGKVKLDDNEMLSPNQIKFSPPSSPNK